MILHTYTPGPLTNVPTKYQKSYTLWFRRYSPDGFPDTDRTRFFPIYVLV